MARPTTTAQQPSRRTLVMAVGVAGLAATLAACGDSGDDKGDDTSSGPRTLGRTAAIPEGGGVIFKKQRVVVTQPAAGDYKAFSAICTHNGCPVASVSGGTINCDCHGSKFDIADGSVRKGPATRPLKAAKVTIAKGTITLR
ncbi:Rieske (2Fe-2S) protein [Streptomyces sp. 796.1]|uniref:Rieske (2Fe-2S) protein n=1 Tax=Streptomyces sp. 796.1 TaxID=3163029 RepID=UPI0039C9FA0E